MPTYEEVISSLSAFADEKYRQFNERIANIPAGSSLGVRMPALRSFAKSLGREMPPEAVLAFPTQVYEIRLLQAFSIGYAKVTPERFFEFVRAFVPRIDCWSVCDAFCSGLKRLKKCRAEFLPYLRSCVREGKEFSQRFANVSLLCCYMDREWLGEVFSLLDLADSSLYYSHMGAAWLLAEVLVHFYDEGVNYLQNGALAKPTKDKAIQKARESYRLTPEQKNFLKLLKN